MSEGSHAKAPMTTLLHRTTLRTLALLAGLLFVRPALAVPFSLLVNGQPTPLDPAPLIVDG